jgi:hypothetical protein
MKKNKIELTKYKKFLITIVIIAIAFISVSSFVVKAATQTTVSGYIILIDRAPEQNIEKVQNYNTHIFLPTTNCKAYATSCSYKFPEGVYPQADINKDGRVDFLDLLLFSKAWYCKKGEDCWNNVIRYSSCYFTVGDIRFKDPSGDCYMNQTDIDIFKKCWYQNTTPFDVKCDLPDPKYDCCRADLDKDGIVYVNDLFLLGKTLGSYADKIIDSGSVKVSDIDFDGDGIIYINELDRFGRSWGAIAKENYCETIPLIHISENEWELNVSGRGLYHVGCSYSCKIL